MENTHNNRKAKAKHYFLSFGSNKNRLLGLLVFLALATFLVWMFVTFTVTYKDRFYPSVFLGGESVGGQTYDEVSKHFKERAQVLEKNGLVIQVEGYKGVQKIKIPMSSTGLTTDTAIEYFTFGDVDQDIQQAYDFGREGNFLRSVTEKLRLLFARKNFNFSATLQTEAVDALLEDELYSFLKTTVSAKFVVSQNTIVIAKEQIGEGVNRQMAVDLLENALDTLATTPVLVSVYSEAPQVTEAELAPFLDLAKAIAKEKNIVFQYHEHSWKITGATLATWLTIQERGGLGIDRDKIGNYLTTTIAKSIDSPPLNSRFEVHEGALVEVVAGTSGNSIDTDTLIKKIEKIIPATSALVTVGTEYIPIDTVVVKPKVTKATVETYEIHDLVGEIRTSFTGSTADRIHNIQIGVNTISGVLIAPNAEFSTIAAIGPVTGKEGYVKEMVIKENTTTKEYGGGLCQVATTLFRLALNAGLPISERQNHKFVVHYYDPPGLDATIYGPHPDFRFVNDTNHYLLLQARVEGNQVVMELYGNKDNRSVTISNPTISNKIPAPPTKYVPTATLAIGQTKCTEAPHDGVTTDVLYTVDYGNGTIKKKNFHSV